MKQYTSVKRTTNVILVINPSRIQETWGNMMQLILKKSHKTYYLRKVEKKDDQVESELKTI